MQPIKDSILVEKGSPSIYKYPSLKFTKEEEEKSINILLLGEMVSGKTTLLDSLVNAVMQVKFEDTFRYVISHESTCKDCKRKGRLNCQNCHHLITDEYNILPPKNRNIPPLKIIDTSIDTVGYRNTLEEELNALKNEIDINKINIICVCIKANTTRISPFYKYIFDNATSLFGKNIKDNFVFMCTFTDGHPEVIKTLDNIFGQHLCYYQFNNRVNFENNAEDEDNISNKFFWKFNMDNFEKFFDRINNNL